MPITDKALALLEFASMACGILAVDRMLKRAPIALLRCGTVHPGRYLALIGGTVASTEEAYREGLATGEVADAIFLPDPHAGTRDAVAGTTSGVGANDTVGVVETATSPALLRSVDAALKAVPVTVAEFRLADDLGGRGLAILRGDLPDVQAALEVAAINGPPADRAHNAVGREAGRVTCTLMARPDESLCDVLNAGTRFAGCPTLEPVGAETVGE